MKHDGSLLTLHLQSKTSKSCICFLQKYQHPPFSTEAICFDTNYSLDNANNEYITLLFHNISLVHTYLRVVTMRSVSNVEGIHH